MTQKTLTTGATPAALPAGYAGIHGGIVEVLDAARRATARSVNALMTASYGKSGAASCRPSSRASAVRATASS